MPFDSAADALCRLLGKCEAAAGLACWISRAPRDIRLAPNGIEYYSVEVTCTDGSQYQLSAFGTEALELFVLAQKNFGLTVPAGSKILEN